MSELSENPAAEKLNTTRPQLWWRRPWALRLFWLLVLGLLVFWVGRNTWEIQRTQREFSQRIADSNQRSQETEKRVLEAGAVLAAEGSACYMVLR
ncbi:MAG: hypothetical protein ACOVML_08865, partial [Burkholderiaceae bacterium]